MEERRGLVTSEFLTTLTQIIVGVAVLSGKFTQAEASEMARAIVDIIGAVLIIAAAGQYVYSRLKLKQTVVEWKARLQGAT